MKEQYTIDEMYEEYYPKIYNYIYYRVLNRELTEDLVSEIFLKAIYRLKSYAPERGGFSTWLYTIAKNTLIDYYRRNVVCEDIDDYSNVLLPSKDNFAAINNETHKKLLAALALLNDRERTIFYYKYYLEMTNRQIAKQMQLNESTVSTIIQRARAKIKKEIDF
ncbi:RNA polymerase sigma factor [Eubacterium callanderi]|uniref:RNA polymerase sigma factor n=1 Tax=Eubacterium callanderi TaxID=53442 RepID=UPI001C1265CD|nr:sigma-70 family RNA polymerase sigma factor [Eubacterium callanderi]MBU5302653.1 sigma-70 family RNA polymerase sigma factor [Eubacterium callanderi]WPK69701.1 RNA polymerase sigma factor YlaC [Eubacterium callanderi]WPK73999.1 RNA polymerase sigma factor YlaC [Eubacterium callanderi]